MFVHYQTASAAFLILCGLGGVAGLIVRYRLQTASLSFWHSALLGMAAVGVPLGIVLNCFAFRMTIADTPESCNQCVAFGTVSLPLGDGETVEVDDSSIVNQTDAILMLETVIYGDVEIEEDRYVLIPPHRVVPVSNAAVTLGPRDLPPDSMEAKGKGTTLRWLRSLNAEERTMLAEAVEESQTFEGNESVADDEVDEFARFVEPADAAAR